MADVSEETLNAVDEEVRRITDECIARAQRSLHENRCRLDRIVEQLLIHETLEESEVYVAAGLPDPSLTPKAAPALP